MKPSENKLRVLSLQFYCYPDEVGGAWKFTYEVNKRLVERGHEVHLLTCKPREDLPDEETVDGIRYYRVGARVGKSVVALWRELRKRVNSILDRHAVGIVHVHNPLVGFLVLLNPRLWAIPKVYHFHSLWHDEEKINRCAELAPEQAASGALPLKLHILLNVIRMIEWICFYTSRSILFLSEYSKGKLLDFYPFAKPELTVIPGGVDTEKFRPEASGLSQVECRRRLGLAEDGILFLTVRRLSARMGLENLITACSLIVQRLPEAKFTLVIVGGGVLRDRLQARIGELRLQDRVRMAGSVTGDALLLHYNAADLFVLPTTAIEGFGLATVEALACGVPVFGTPIGGTVEILQNIDSRLLFADTTPEALAAKLEEFLRDSRPFLALRGRCREIVAQKYGWGRVVDRIEQEFFKVARPRSCGEAG